MITLPTMPRPSVRRPPLQRSVLCSRRLLILRAATALVLWPAMPRRLMQVVTSRPPTMSLTHTLTQALRCLACPPLPVMAVPRTLLARLNPA